MRLIGRLSDADVTSSEMLLRGCGHVFNLQLLSRQRSYLMTSHSPPHRVVPIRAETLQEQTKKKQDPLTRYHSLVLRAWGCVSVEPDAVKVTW